MLNLLRVTAVMIKESNINRNNIRAERDETIAQVKTVKYDKHTVAIEYVMSNSHYKTSLKKMPLGYGELAVEDVDCGVKATKIVKVPKQFISVGAALDNMYFEEEITRLTNEVKDFARRD